MYSTQTETECVELPASVVLAAQVLDLGLRHARPHLWHQCGHNAPATRYKNTHVTLISTIQKQKSDFITVLFDT